MRWRLLIAALVFSLALTSLALAADSTIRLKDGTVLVGELKKYGSSYRITMPDGSTKMIPASEVVEIDGKPVGTADASGSEKAPGLNPPVSGGGDFQRIKSKADRVEEPLVAVQMWEDWINKNEKSGDLETAKVELEKWKQLQKDGAEKIKGKWIWGDELKELQKKLDTLVEEGIRLEGTQTQEAIKKYQAAIALNPKSYIANFRLGYFLAHLGRPGEMDKAIKCLEVAKSEDGASIEVLCNLAALYNIRNRYEDSIVHADKALQILNDPEIVGVFLKSIQYAPRRILVANSRVRDIYDRNRVIIKDVGAGEGAGGAGWIYYPPGYFENKTGGVPGAPPGVSDKRQGHVWSGSGFFITPDGYLLTNHHVATGEADTPIDPTLSYRIRMHDDTEYLAELIAVDDKADIALMKVKLEEGKKVPYLKVAEDDPPAAGDALVLGYPATSMTGNEKATLQVDPGSVKSVHPGDEHEVWFDLSTTHGNSGGPIVDNEERVIGILTAGREVYNVVYVMGVGPNQIERFLNGLGDKAPKIEYATASDPIPQFNAVNLTKKCQDSTLYIMVIRGAEQKPSGEAEPATTNPTEGGPGQPAGAAEGSFE